MRWSCTKQTAKLNNSKQQAKPNITTALGLSFLISAVSAAICFVRSFSFVVSIDRMYYGGVKEMRDRKKE